MEMEASYLGLRGCHNVAAGDRLVEMSARGHNGEHTVTSVIPSLFIPIWADESKMMFDRDGAGFLSPGQGYVFIWPAAALNIHD
jgi:hypothetical protein